ncbi:putative Asparagine synthase [Giardia duodenalis]|uniref:Asparagine synthase n=1 Tax=Giardia intestinalis (strain ATCC 50803 / WB clone C6) TaxID=184922 RepID=A8BYH5_GIAIC|nr:putative Asparagine synthase [Giardia intestinalis]KAE8302711.1 putative Asparagine synthase [Giardia intestinalis]|eukprot:XP_001704173.1 Asparagine synthase, putative [Giardia lamblia ATCC 50803]
MSVTLAAPIAPEAQPKFLVEIADNLSFTLFTHTLTVGPYAGCECISTFAQAPDSPTLQMLLCPGHEPIYNVERISMFILILDREKQRIEVMTDHHSRVVLCYNKSGIYLREKCVGLKDLAFILPGHTFFSVLTSTEHYLSLEKYIPFTEVVPSLSQAMEMHFEPSDNLVMKFLEILKELISNQLSRHPEIRILASGGIDSTLLVYICATHILEKSQSRIELFNINFFEFAKDAVAFRSLCDSPRLQRIVESCPDRIKITSMSIPEVKFRSSLQQVRDLIAPCPPTVMMLNLGSILFHSTRRADGSEIDVPVMSGLGPDEYCGAYAALRDGDTCTWKLSVKHACQNLFERNITRDSGVFSRVVYPYLEPMVAAFFNYLMESERYEYLRNKKILRDAAWLLGVPPELVARPKQAAQFGSGCAKILKGGGYDTVCLACSYS